MNRLLTPWRFAGRSVRPHAVALTILAGLGTLIALAAPVSARRGAGPRVSVRRGSHFGAAIFPNNTFTVRDRANVTGRQIHFRLGVDYPSFRGAIHRRCTSADYSICDGFAELNKLDGFDTNPWVMVPFTGPIRLSSVTAKDFYISNTHGRFASGLRQLTFDPATHTLSGIADAFLREDTTYEIHVTKGILDRAGRAVNACGKACVVRFTTRTASGELVRIRKAMDLPLSNPHNAYVEAGFAGASHSAASRRLSFVQHGKADVPGGQRRPPRSPIRRTGSPAPIRSRPTPRPRERSSQAPSRT